MFTAIMDNVATVSVNAIQVTREHFAISHVSAVGSFQTRRDSEHSFETLADLCASINCNYGMCYEGRCQCSEGYTGGFCETPSKREDILLGVHPNLFSLLKIVSTTTLPPVPIVATTSGRLLLTAKPVGLAGPKTGQLIDYGRLLGARGPGIGWILGLVGAFLLIPLALAFAARQCTQGACVPVGGPGGYIPVKTGATGVTQTEGGRNIVDVIRDVSIDLFGYRCP